MNPQARAAGQIAGVTALTVAASTTDNTPAHALAWALIAATCAAAISAAHDLICTRFATPFVVYGLFDTRDNLIYIGSSEDLAARLRRHLADRDIEPWKHKIASVAVLRNCHTEKQAQRIERRRIRSIWVAQHADFTVRIENDTWFSPAANPVARFYRWAWMRAYLTEQNLRPAKRWLRNAATLPVAHPEPIDAEPADELDPINDDPEPAPAAARTPRPGLLIATYERPASRQAPTGQTDATAATATPDRTRHASRVTPHTPPVGGCGPDSVTRDNPGQGQRDSVSLADLIGAAHERHVRKVNPKAKAGRKAAGPAPAQDSPSTDPGPDGESADERRKRLARERQQRRRAKTRD